MFSAKKQSIRDHHQRKGKTPDRTNGHVFRAFGKNAATSAAPIAAACLPAAYLDRAA
jgi:hypothetical protein